MGALLRTSTEEDKCEGEKFNARVLACLLEWERAWEETNGSPSANSTGPSDEAKS
jgi:hypothetical protein